MATTSKSGLRYDEFVKNIRPDPKSNDPLVMLQGYIGKSDLDGHVRVYSDPALSDFIDLPEREICYADPVKPEEDPLGGSRLWVRKTAVFTTGDPNLANRVKSSFLEGDLLNAFGGAEGIPGAVLAGGIREKLSVPIFNCPNNSLYGPICPITRRPQICNITFAKPTCDRTCLQVSCNRTCLQPTCNRTCLQPTCFRTCGFVCTASPLCNVYTEKCPKTIVNCPYTLDGCPVSLGCPTQIGCPSVGVCPTFGACPTMACTEVFEPINPAVQQQYNAAGYGGGFNPYDTGNFGY